MDHDQFPSLSQILSLLKDYDGQIYTIWNLYIVVVSSLLVVINSEKVRAPLISVYTVFVVFAVSNWSALSRTYSVKWTLLDYGLTLTKGDRYFDPLFRGILAQASLLRLPRWWCLLIQHAVVDCAVMAMFFLLYQRRKRAIETVHGSS